MTGEFAPYETDITHSISASSLQPGDAVNNSDHVMLFKAWVSSGHEATFIEEPGCSANPPHAHEFTSSVSLNGDSIYVSYNGMTFTAIRYNSIGGGSSPSGPPACEVDGVQGTCIDTSACAAKSGYHSTAGYCPGPSGEECCTKESAPAAPPSCEVDGVQGTCIDRSVCMGKSGYQSTPGYCPGPDSEECCTKEPAAPPPAPTCDVEGVSGTCISTSACAAKSGYHSTSGYCPGPSSEECCTKEAAAPPPTGPSCTVEGVSGVCIDKGVCSGMSGHVSTPGFCPGPASEECCTKPPTCSAHGVSGMCVETSVCAGLGRHSTAGLCPGPANEECCTP